jgi:DNA-binding MarR family transcriptional regulator
MGHACDIPEKNIVDAFRRLIRSVHRDSRKISRQFGLTGSQSAVMRSLLADGSLSSAALGRKLYVTAANITGIVDRLEKRQLVRRVRQTGDRRVTLIELTKSGKELAQRLPDPFEKNLITALSLMETNKVRHLGVALRQINQLIDADGAGDELSDADRDFRLHG